MHQSVNNAAPWGAQKTKGYWRSAVLVWKDRRAVVTAGMLLALHIILSMFLGIYLTQTVKISVSFITNVVTGYLFGPCMAFVTGALGDILQYIIKPAGGYFFGWTLNAAIGGLVYGLAFYRHAPRAAYDLKGSNSTVNVSQNYHGMEDTPKSNHSMMDATKNSSVEDTARNSHSIGETKKSTHRITTPLDFISAGIFAAMLVCWAALPFLQAPAKQQMAEADTLNTGSTAFNTGSALGFLTKTAGECVSTSPRTLAAVSLVLILAGMVFVLCKRRLPVLVLSAAACLWLLLPVYTDRKVLTAKSGFVLLCVGFALCAVINLVAVLRAKALDAGFLLRCFVAMLFMAVVVQMFLGTIWCTVMYGKGFWFYFVPRAIKSLIQLPFNAILAYYVIRAVRQIRFIR